MRFQHKSLWLETARALPELISEGGNRWLCRIAGDCQSPVVRFYDGLEAPSLLKDWAVSWSAENPRLTVEYHVRCRKCPHCRKAHGRHWRYRMKSECRSAVRTWFVTLTFSPESHFCCEVAADRRLLAGGWSIDEAENAGRRFVAIEREHYERLKLYFKRLRKSGADLRYCFVAERHKSGAVHYHGLVHEVREDAPVRHKLLKAKWDQGFMDARLIAADGPEPAYVAKYVSKCVEARVRASQRYGVAR